MNQPANHNNAPRWRLIYAAVLFWLVAVIGLLTLFTAHFTS